MFKIFIFHHFHIYILALLIYYTLVVICFVLCVIYLEVAQSCPTLWDPTDCSLPDSSVHTIFQARVLEWVAISFCRRSSQPRDWTWASCIAGRWFTVWATREATVIYLIWNQKRAREPCLIYKSSRQLNQDQVIFGLSWWLKWQRICLQQWRSGFSRWVWKIPWRWEWLPTLVFLPGELHWQRSLVDYSSLFAKIYQTTYII